MRIRHLAAVLISVSCAFLAAPCLQSPAMAQDSDSGEAQSPNDAEPSGEALQESWGPDDSGIEATYDEGSPLYVDPSQVSEAEHETFAPEADDDDVDESDIHWHDVWLPWF